jgi:hypothetical protein
METIDSNNNVSTETQHVATHDIKNMDPCQFPNRTNPVTGKNCSEGMTNKSASRPSLAIPDDIVAKAYMLGVSGLLLYLLYRLTTRRK